MFNAKEYKREWNRLNRDKINARNRAKYAAKREENREKSRLKNQKYKERRFLSTKKYKKNHKDRYNAGKRLSRHVKAFKLIRPITCTLCSKVEKIQAHHWDYSKPLEVLWVCRACHAYIHLKHPIVEKIKKALGKKIESKANAA